MNENDIKNDELKFFFLIITKETTLYQKKFGWVEILFVDK
jgi:hypothetical protein